MIMRGKVRISAVALVLIAASATVWIHARTRRHAAWAAHGVAVRAAEDANSALQHAEIRLRSLDTPGNAMMPSPAGVTDSPELSSASEIDSHRALRQDPELQALELTAKRAALELNYAPLFRTLKLSPPQVAQFCDHLMRREAAKSDLQAAAEALPEHDVAVYRLQERAEKEYEKAQLALLGDSGAQQTVEFERTLRVREGVAALARTATLANVPVTPEQSDRLLHTLLSATTRRSDNTFDFDSIDWVKVSEDAKTFLSPAQWTIVTSVETDALAPFSAILQLEVELARKMRRLQKTAAAR